MNIGQVSEVERFERAVYWALTTDCGSPSWCWEANKGFRASRRSWTAAEAE
jgi:hypothetical protein